MNIYNLSLKINESEFSWINDNYEKIKKFLSKATSIEELQNWLFEEIDEYKRRHGKCDERSRQYRKQGNAFFKKKEYKSAIDSYSQAIVNAYFPSDSGKDQLIRCYACRSKAYFEDKQYNKALYDANCSLRLQSSFEMLKQKIDCLLLLNRKKEALESIPNKRLSKKLINYLQQIKSSLGDDFDKIVNQIQSETKEKAHIKANKFIKVETYIHDNMALKMNPTKGRSYVATDDILANTELIVEKPFSYIIFDSFLMSYCSCCGKRVDNNFWPCQACNEVVFCDEECAQNSMNDFHRFECGFVGKLNESSPSSYIVFRILTRIGCDTALCLNQTNADNGLTDEMLAENTDIEMIEIYKKYQTLLAHIEDTRRELSSNTLVCAILVAVHLQYAQAFKCQTNDLHRFAKLSTVIFKHINQVLVNGFGYYENSNTDDNYTDVYFQSRHMGNAYVYDASFFNHSCEPNLSWKFADGRMIYTTTKLVNNGEELCISYGASYMIDKVKIRRKHMLEKYHFTCHCSACVKETTRLLSIKCRDCEDGIVKYDPIAREGKCMLCDSQYNDIMKTIEKVESTKAIVNVMIKNIYQSHEIDLSLNVVEKSLIKLAKLMSADSSKMIELKRNLAFACNHINRFDLVIKFGKQLLIAKESTDDLVYCKQLLLLSNAYNSHLLKDKVEDQNEWQMCLDINLELVDRFGYLKEKLEQTLRNDESKDTLQTVGGIIEDKKVVIQNLNVLLQDMKLNVQN